MLNENKRRTQPQRLHPLWLIGLYAVAMGGISAFIVLTDFPNQLLMAMIIPIPLVALYYPRRVYSSLVLISIGLAVGVTHTTATSFSASLITIAMASLAIICLAELIRWLAVERFKVEEKLRASEARFRSFVTNSPDAIYSIDLPTHQVTYFNRDEFLGYTRAELEQPSTSILYAVHPDDKAAAAAFWRTVLAGTDQTEHSIEFRMHPKNDDHWEWLQNRATVLTRTATGAPLQALITLTLTTAQHRVADALRESEEMYRSLVDVSPDAIAVLDSHGKVLVASNRTTTMFGGTLTDILGTNVFDWLVPADHARAKSHIEHTFNQIYADDNRYTFRKHDGSVFIGEVNARVQHATTNLVAVIRDVTNDETLAAALRASENRLALIYNSMSDLAFLMRVEPNECYRCEAVNQAYLVLTGLTEAQLIGKRTEEILPEPAARFVLEKYREAIHAGVPIHYEETAELPAGHRVVETTLTPLFDPDGQCAHLLGIARDITEGKQIEATLRESEERYRALVDNLPDPVLVHLDGKIVYTNPIISTLTGLTREQLIGRSIQEFVSTDDARLIAENVRRRLANELVEDYEINVVANPGAPLRVIVRATPIMYGGKRALLVVLIDITARTYAEEAVRTSKRMLQLVIDNIPQNVYWKDRALVYVGCNQNQARALELDPQHIVGKTDHDLFPQNLNAERRMAAERRVIEEDAPEYHIVQSQRTPDGAIRWLDTSRIPLHDSAGKLNGILGMWEDITDRIHAEDVLREGEARNRALLEAMPDMMFVHNKHGAFLDYHSPDPKSLLVPPEQFLGKTPRDVLPAALAERYMRLMNQVAQSKQVGIFEYSLPSSDGEHYFEARMIAFSQDRVLTILRDITQRKRAEDQARATQEKFHTLVEQIPGVVYSAEFGRAGQWFYVSSYIKPLLGFTVDEWLGDPALYFKQVHPDDYARVTEAGQQSQATGAPYDCEFRMLARDGHVVWVRNVGTVIQDSNGRNIGLQGLILDVTARQQAAAALARRDVVLQAVAFVSDQFLRAQSWREPLSQVLARLGTATNVSRVYLDQNQLMADGRFVFGLCADWTAPGVNFEKKQVINYFDPYANGFERWVETLETGAILQGNVREFPAQEQALLLALPMRSVLVVPLFVKEAWWGQIGFVETETERVWSAMEIDALKAAAAAISAAIERQQAEELLRASQERNAALLDSIPDMMFILDQHGVYLDYHVADANALLMRPEQFLGKPVAHVMPPPVAAKILDGMARAHDTGMMQVIDFPLTARDGLRHYELRLTPLGADKMLAIARDVTERQKAEQALRTSQAELAFVADGIPGLVTHIDTQERYLFVNNAYAEWLGHSADELIGMTVQAALIPSVYQVSAPYIQRAIRGERVAFERVVLDRAGDLRTQSVSYVPQINNDGIVQGMFTLILDVTEQRALQDSLRQLSRAVEQSPVSIVITNLLGAIEYVNPKFTQITGYSFEEALGKNPRILKSGETTQETYAHMWQTILNGGEWRGEFHNKKKNGELYWESAFVSPIMDARGTITHLLAVKEDITERKWMEEAEREQRALAEALRDTADALNSTLKFDDVLDRILTNVGRMVPHDAANIMLMDDEGVTVRVARSRGYLERGDDDIAAMRFTVNAASSLRQMEHTGQPLVIADTRANPDWFANPATRWVCSYAGAPIRIRKKMIGFLNLDSATPGFYNFDHAERLQVFADQAAIAIENARLFNETTRRADQMDTVNKIGLAISAGLDLQQIARTLYEQCNLVAPVDAFYVALYDAKAHQLHFPLFLDHAQPLAVGPFDLYTQPGLTGQVIQTGQTLYIPDVLDPNKPAIQQHNRAGGEPTRTYVGVPLRLRDQVIGVLSVQSYQPNAYSADQIDFIETIATQAAVAIENARLYAEVQQLAVTDALTSTFNRRGLVQLGEREVERAQRFQHPLSVVMLDIDHFKRVNDTYGHPIGDRVLCALADCCRANMRTVDIVARYGGEEFVMLLPETDLASAVQVAERLRQTVEKAQVSVEVDEQMTGRTVHVTVSQGVVTMSPDTPTLAALFERVDQALYVAKQSGRNRVAVSE